jgi:hypothetical protein
VRELRDREHEHQIEEQLDKGDAVVIVPVPYPKLVRRCREHGDHQQCIRMAVMQGPPKDIVYLIASGLTGEPTAPVIGIAGATNMNS